MTHWAPCPCCSFSSLEKPTRVHPNLAPRACQPQLQELLRVPWVLPSRLLATVRPPLRAHAPGARPACSQACHVRALRQKHVRAWWCVHRVKCCVAVKVNTAKRCDGCDLGLRQQVNNVGASRLQMGDIYKAHRHMHTHVRSHTHANMHISRSVVSGSL